ncbi:MAG TPA: DUF1330 domain-containing protein [Candidatus Binataceae bacterium]|nr:DUF1330 domain-containing protein [Candidatus Binataceae bacterium]
MSSNVPRPEAVQALAQSTDPSKVVMLNLLKFKPDGGVESYRKYVEHVTPILQNIGARVVYAGPVTEVVIGNPDWDAILLVEYPSRKAFIGMVTSPEYQAIHHFRDEALIRGELHATAPTGDIAPAGKT